jgi:hypothetical protein
VLQQLFLVLQQLFLQLLDLFEHPTVFASLGPEHRLFDIFIRQQSLDGLSVAHQIFLDACNIVFHISNDHETVSQEIFEELAVFVQSLVHQGRDDR